MSLQDVVIQDVQSVLAKKWALGWNDRGMGHGDWGVVVDGEGTLVFGPIGYRSLAEHVIELHNASLPKPKAKPRKARRNVGAA